MTKTMAKYIIGVYEYWVITTGVYKGQICGKEWFILQGTGGVSAGQDQQGNRREFPGAAGEITIKLKRRNNRSLCAPAGRLPASACAPVRYEEVRTEVAGTSGTSQPAEPENTATLIASALAAASVLLNDRAVRWRETERRTRRARERDATTSREAAGRASDHPAPGFSLCFRCFRFRSLGSPNPAGRG